MSDQYAIGTPGTPWGDSEKSEWLQQQTKQRSYERDVVDVIESLKKHFDVTQYGTLDYAQFGFEDYPLYVVKTRNWQKGRPVVLVTGGVHGYETSGVHGALRFLQAKAAEYERYFNVVVAPCISPWGYETINRWNPKTIDPNRSFKEQSGVPETAQLMAYIANLNEPVLAHIDLHETTDTDNSEFRPALAARDGVIHDNWDIPDGFYLVGNSVNPEIAFQQAVLDSVATVTHIADADQHGCLIGEPIAERGLIFYKAQEYGLCMGFTNARYVTTTEVYPDSEQATPEECILAQVAAVTGGFDYVARAL
ncbi:MAG: M14 family metallocarboxypeptidase [Idiomarina sp.]|nr:M14 family metallocarboxypeptidase [Idiomarina sp.]